MKTIPGLSSCGQPLDLVPASFGQLRASADLLQDEAELRSRLATDGYLFVPGFFPKREIQSVRDEILRRLEAQQALQPGQPLARGVPVVRSVDVRAVVRDNTALHGVVYSTQLEEFYERLLGGAIRHYDHIWLRVIAPGPGTPPHCDRVYMGRGTVNVMTAWIPYGDVSLTLGGLMLLEKSHTQAERLRPYLESDADTYCENRNAYLHKSGYLSTNPVTLREKLGGRWLTAEFQMGDLLTFGMHTVHASLDNQTQAYRLSSDTRYQLAAEPIDPRWVGPDTEEYAVKNRMGKVC